MFHSHGGGDRQVAALPIQMSGDALLERGWVFLGRGWEKRDSSSWRIKSLN